MNSVINYICSPGLGHLDNSLPIIIELKKYTKKKSNIFFVKESLVNHLMNNPTLHNIHKKTFDKNYIQVKNMILSSPELKKIHTLINNKILKLFIFKFLIPLKLKFFYLPLFKKLNVKIFSLKELFNTKDIVIFDPYEIIQKKKYFFPIYPLIKNNFKIGIRHGIGNDQIIGKKNSDQKMKINFDNLIYLSHSKKQSTYVQNKIKISKKKILNSGVLKFSNKWKNEIEKKAFNIKSKEKDKFVYIISRHTTNYFKLEKKIYLIKLLKKILIEKFKLKLIIKFHPKEDPITSYEIYKRYLGEKDFNKIWFIYNHHSFKICKICKFGVSFVSSVALDLLSYKKLTIEIINLDNKSSNYEISFVKNKLVLIPKNVIHFEKIIEKILKKKIKHNCFKNFNKLYYKPKNLNTLKTINKHYNEYCCNLR
jgi:hypothetical protein